MKYWKQMANNNEYGWTDLKGKNNWGLRLLGGNSQIKQYYLYNNEEICPKMKDEDYQETENYFYATFELSNGIVIYTYVAKSSGGAIQFRGKGRWSGNVDGLGKDLDIKLMSISIDSVGGLGISNEDAAQILNKYFDGLRYEMKDGFIVIDWNKTIQELRNTAKIRKIVRKEIEEISKKINKK